MRLQLRVMHTVEKASATRLSSMKCFCFDITSIVHCNPPSNRSPLSAMALETMIGQNLIGGGGMIFYFAGREDLHWTVSLDSCLVVGPAVMAE